MKILLTGRLGQVGSVLHPQLAEFGTLTALDRSEVDFTDVEALQRCLNSIAPDLIVNAAAYTDVDGAESHRDTTFAINAAAPATMARWAAGTGAALIHYSTDYVFDGSGSTPRTEIDKPAPLNVYGESKQAGDDAILDSGAAVLILRTSWVYAAKGRNFLRTMLRLGTDRESLSVVDDQIGAPTPASVLAKITIAILWQADGDPADLFRAKGGLINATTAGETSWHGFAEAIFEIARRQGWNLAIRDLQAIPSSGYPLPAARPLNSRLNLSRLKARFGIHPPHWRTALEAVMSDLR